MNKLLIPPSPNWYSINIGACAPDGTLLYGAQSSIVIITPTPDEEPNDIKIISYAHYERITGICVNPQWGLSSKRFVSIADDKIVKLWSCDKYDCTLSHKTHTTTNTKLIGVTFAGEDRVISVSEDGLIAIWKISTNEITPIKHILGIKAQVTAIASCPHAAYLVAFGLKGGLVVLVDMRKDGTVKYKLRGHDKDILSLSWCPISLNVLCRKESKIIERNVENKSETSTNVELKSEASTVEVGIVELKSESSTLVANIEPRSDISTLEESIDKSEASIEKDGLEASDSNISNTTNETPEQSKKKVNPWINLRFPDDDEIVEETRKMEPATDFEAECLKVMELIKGKDDTNDSITEDNKEVAVEVEERKKIEPRRKLKKDSNLEKVDDKTPSMEGDFVDETIDEAKEKEDKDEKLFEQISDILEDVDEFNKSVEEMIDKLSDVKIKDNSDHGDSSNGDTSKVTGTEKVDSNKSDSLINKLNELNIKNQSLLDVDKAAGDALPKDYLLASSSRDGTICFWRASGGRLEKKILAAKKSRKTYRGDKIWISLNWVTPTILLAAGQNAELNRWNLTDNEIKAKIVHPNHNKNLFAILSSCSKFESVEVSDEGLGVWTIGQDRMLLYSTIDTQRKSLMCYPTLGSYVQNISASLIDPNRIAIGLSDGTIRIWNLSNPHLKHLVMNEIKLKVNAKILSLAWHPSNESYLAYGSEEGEIGLVNPYNIGKAPIILTRFFRHAIYKLQWAPFKQSDDFYLFVCAEGTLCYYDVNKPLSEPEVVNLPQKQFVTQMAWKEDYSLLAVGTKIGNIYIFSKDLELKSTIYYQKQAIVSINWHPSGTAEDESSSPCEYWFASSCTTNSTIVVYNLANLTNEKFDIKDGIVAELNGHSSHVNTMFWSTFHNGRLASVGDDGTMQIWNVYEKKSIATIININVDPILAGIWSPLDENFIIIAGKECAVQIIDIREYAVKTVEEINELRIKRRKQLEKFKSIKQQDDKLDIDKPKKGVRDCVLNIVSSRQNNRDCALADCRSLLAQRDGENVDKNCVLQIYGNEDDMKYLLEQQYVQHLERGKPNLSQHIGLWQGNIGDTIKDAIINKTLTPWLISIAPMISFSLWQEACDSYAETLLDNANSDPLEAASYLLASHKVNKAIEVLCSRSLFREALAIAKCRMAKDDDLINDILQKWANYCNYTGSLEIAAQNYIVMGKYEDAANNLYKRMKIEELELAVELALLADNKDLHATILFSLNEMKNKCDNKQEEEEDCGEEEAIAQD